MAIKIRKKSPASPDGQPSSEENASDAPRAAAAGENVSPDVATTGANSASVGAVSAASGGTANTGGAVTVLTTETTFRTGGSPTGGDSAPREVEAELIDPGGPHGGRVRPPVGGDGQGLQLTGAGPAKPQGPSASDWIRDNHKRVLIATGVLLAFVVVFQVWRSVHESSLIKESDSLTTVIHTFEKWTGDEGQQFVISPPPLNDDDPQPKPAGVFPDDTARLKKALERVDAALQEYGDDDITAEAKLLKGSIVFELGKYKDAQDLSDQASGALAKQDQIFALRLKADALQATGKYAEAIKVYKEIRGLSPHYAAMVLEALGQLHELNGDPDAAAEAYKKLLTSKTSERLEALDTIALRAKLTLLTDDVEAFLGEDPQSGPAGLGGLRLPGAP